MLGGVDPSRLTNDVETSAPLRTALNAWLAFAVKTSVDPAGTRKPSSERNPVPVSMRSTESLRAASKRSFKSILGALSATLGS